MEERTTQDFVRHLTEKLGYDEACVASILDSYFQEVCLQLKQTGRFETLPLGAFGVLDRPARTVHHPATGKPVQVPARQVIAFKAGPSLESRIEQGPETAERIPEVPSSETKPSSGFGFVAPSPTRASADSTTSQTPSPESVAEVPSRKTPPPGLSEESLSETATASALNELQEEPSAGISPTATPVPSATVEEIRDSEDRISEDRLDASPDAGTNPGVRFGARVLCVASGKGGTGKSFTVCNLAVRMATLGQRVILLDADLGLANLHLLLGINPRYNLSHVLGGELSLVDIMEEGPCGIQLISGGSGVVRLANLKEHELLHFVQGLAELEDHADLIIIDTAAGISPRTVSFLAASREILLVTTPDITAMTDAYAILKSVALSGRDNQTVSLVVNQASTPGEAQAVHDRLSGVSRKFLGRELESLGYIYEDPAVVKAVALRTPLILSDPGSRAAQGVVRLAKRIRESKLPHQNPRRYADRLRGILVNQAI